MSAETERRCGPDFRRIVKAARRLQARNRLGYTSPPFFGKTRRMRTRTAACGFCIVTLSLLCLPLGADDLDAAAVRRIIGIAEAARATSASPTAPVRAFNEGMVAAFGRPPVTALVESVSGKRRT